MQLTKQGIAATKYSEDEKRKLAKMLLRGELDVNQFATGVCYDAAAFLKYLIDGSTLRDGRGISTIELTLNAGQKWIAKLTSEERWQHGSAIPIGSVVTFFRLRDNQVFHAGVATGQTSIRAVNGLLLGAGWKIPADLIKHIHKLPRNDRVYRYDNTEVIVQIQQPATGALDLLT